MTINRLIIHLPTSTHTVETDDASKLSQLSDFCKEEMGAYHSTKNVEELTVDEISEEMNDKFHSLLFKLGLN